MKKGELNKNNELQKGGFNKHRVLIDRISGEASVGEQENWLFLKETILRAQEHSILIRRLATECSKRPT